MIRGRAVPESRAVQELGAKRGSDGMESRHVCGCLARRERTERAVEPLRGHGVRIRSSVRWGETITMNSRLR